jgi:mRNA interferase RelE/StbE
VNLKITKQALKFLEGLDAKQYKQVGSTIFSLLSNPEPHDSSMLKGATKGERRVDIGEYRIIYSVEDAIPSILVVGKRNGDEVYKIWERSR